MSLLPGKALLWQQRHTLIVADLHWGKTAHFRKHGIAIPINAQHNDEIRLAELIRQHKVERLIVAGDMFHSRENNEVDNFSHWRNAHKELSIDLVLGNHDILPEEMYTGNNMAVHEAILDEGSFIISHDEIAEPGKFYIHGHIHPAFVVSGRGRNNIKLPCYCMNDKRLVLPSFGSFTGSHKVSTKEYSHIYVIAEDEVIQWQ